MVPAEDLPSDYQFTTGDLRENKFPGFDSMPVEQTKPCSVLIETVPEGNKTTTITITTMPVAELIPTEPVPETPEIKSTTIDIPGFGEVPSEETKPCIISTKPIYDGYKTTLMTTTITALKDDPKQGKDIPVSWNDINISGIVDGSDRAQLGIYVVKTIGDDDNPTTITGTLVTTEDGSSTPDVIPRRQDKAAIVSQKAFKDGDITTTVTTTMVPAEDLPSDYQFTKEDLRENKFPGFDSMPVEQTKPCSVLIETVPEGKKTTTITITTMPTLDLMPVEEEEKEFSLPEDISKRVSEETPLTVVIPGFGEVPTEDTKQCIISTKEIKDGTKTTLVTTTMTASQNVDNENVPVGWKDIDTSGFIDKSEQSTPGIFVVKEVQDTGIPTTIVGTLVTSDNEKPAYPIAEYLRKGQERKAVLTTKIINEGNKTLLATTTMIPLEDLPKDYTFTNKDLKDGKFPGFNQLSPDNSKPCKVTIDSIPEGNKTTTVSITSIATDEKPFMIEFPGFGTVPREEATPCIVADRTVTDGNKVTLMSTTVTAFQDIPGTNNQKPLPASDINISDLFDSSEKSKPGVIAIKRIDDDGNPVTVNATLVTSEDLPSKYLDFTPAGESKPGITSSRAFKEDDTTTTVTTTLVPVKGLPEGNKSNFAKLKEQGFPGFDIISPDKDSTKPCTVTTNSVKEGKKVTTVTLTEVPDVRKVSDASKSLPVEIQAEAAKIEPEALNNEPCTVTTKTVKDGKKECLITSVLVNSKDLDDISKVDSLETSPDMQDARPGTFTRETAKDGDDEVTVETTKVTAEEIPSKKKGKNKGKDKKPTSETRPGIVTTKKVKHNNKAAVLTTTLVPLQGTPKGYENNILDLLSSGFPGFNAVADDEVKPCSVTIDTIPEGNKTTTITKVTSKDVPEPELEGTPCTISSKTVKDGKKESIVTISLFIDTDKAEKKELDTITDGFPKLDNIKPGTTSSVTTTDDEKITTIHTVRMTDETKSKGFKGLKRSKDKKTVSETKPGITTSYKVKESTKIGTVFTTIVPKQGMPKGHENNMVELRRIGFPGFSTLRGDEGRPCEVKTETVTDGGKTTTTITTTTSQDKPRTVELPGFGNVPNEDSIPCIVSSKTIKDGKKTTMVTTTVTASQEMPDSKDTTPIQAKNIDISKFIEKPENSQEGTITTRVDDATRKPVTVFATVVMSDDNKPAYVIPNDMPEDKEIPAIVTTKSIKDGDKTTTITTTTVPIQDVQDDHKFTTSDLKKTRFPGFDSIPLGDTKSCTVKLQNIPDKNKSSLVTTTTVPIQEKPLMIEYPGIGNAFSEDAKPCVISTETFKDGKDETLVSTTITVSQDVPGTEESVPIEASEINPSGFMENPSNVQPGIVVAKITDDAEPKTVTATLVTSTDGKPGIVIPQTLPKGKDRPAIITTKSTKDGEMTTTVTTTMIPITDLPANYNITLDDVNEKRFPGFDNVPKGDTRACTVTVDNVPEGNKVTTVTTATMAIDGKPLLIEVPGFGNMPAEDTKPCVVTTKTIEDDNNSTMVITTVTAYQEVPDGEEAIPLDAKSIQITGFVDSPEDSKPGIFVIKSLDTDRPVTMTGTVVTSEDDTPAYPIPDDMPTGKAKPAIQTTKSIKEGDITATVTTTMVPLLDLPDNYTFTS